MKKGIQIAKGYRITKAFVLSFIIFIILIAIVGLLLRFTSLPEKWTYLYVLLSLCIACLLVGLSAGHVIQKKGILVGILFSIIFLLLIIIGAALITGMYSEAGLLRIRYLPCIIFGAMGGMIGVNMKAA
ncbi:MAG TPA: TIGR04086 family membrane protein [Anaerovoracaceae bacterium]|nr:TIGR04086 family membrane protein [Anaerovoracaceae bacterium]